MYKVLIIEDDEAIANLIALCLRKNGYQCEIALDGCEGADAIQERKYDIGIFDIMLPGYDGYDLLEYAKSVELPVIFMTAKDQTKDKVKGLKAGADDYMTKPFEQMELLARVENVLRHYHKETNQYQIGSLHIDEKSRIVSREGMPIELTCKEFDLLLLFIKNKNIALYRETIYENVWGCEYSGDSRTVDLHVQRLRKKTGLMKEIESVYKVGYRLR